MDIYRAVDAISEDLLRLVDAYFTDCENIGADFEGYLKRRVFDLLDACNRNDLPERARVPFVDWVVRAYGVDAYNGRMVALDSEALSRERVPESVSIKSTSVKLGASEYDMHEAKTAAIYANTTKELALEWDGLVASLRRLRW